MPSGKSKGVFVMWPKEINQAPSPSLAKVSFTSNSLLHCRGVSLITDLGTKFPHATLCDR